MSTAYISLPPRDVVEALIKELPSESRIKAGSAHAAFLRATSEEMEQANAKVLVELLGL